MPRTPSVKKSLRQSARRRQRNLKRKDALQAVLKQYKKLLVAGKKAEASAYLPQVYKKLDKASKEHLIKKNKAARLKSRLTKLLKR